MDKLVKMNDSEKELLEAVGIEKNKSPRLAETGGRVLYNHAIMYTSEGNGFFEDTETPKHRVVPGTVFYLYANRWHNFDPDPGTTWDEHWILFDGKLAVTHFGNLFPASPIQKIGIDHDIQEIYEELHDLFLFRSKGYREYSSFLVHKLLMELFIRINKLSLKRKDSVIYDFKRAMKKNIGEKNFDLQQTADKMNIGYETLRKRFKRETGMSPNNYLLRLKITHAKVELLKPSLSIKEIAYSLGFEDPYYFSRLFKRKTGMSPETFRKRQFVVKAGIK